MENNFQNTKIIAPHLVTVLILWLLFTVSDRTQLRLKQRRIYLLRELRSSEITANFIYELKFICVIEYLSLSRVNQWFALVTFVLMDIYTLCWKVAKSNSTLIIFQLSSFSGKYGYPFLITQKLSQDWVLVAQLVSSFTAS